MIRACVLGLVLSILPALSSAQTLVSGKVWRVGVLMPERAGALEEIVEGLREHQYVEGRNMILDVRRAVRSEQLRPLAVELVKLKPDVIVSVTGTAALAAREATKTIPIVMATSGDAVRQGLIASLARPGGNVTGLTVISPDLAAKRPEILKETLPRAERIGVLGCASGEPVGKAQWLAVQSVAERLALRLVPMLIQRVEELASTLEAAIGKGIDAVLVFDCGVLSPPASVTGPLNKARLAAVYHAPRYVHANGLMSYGSNSTVLYRRSATFVDKILKGARPADLPVEQPQKFELVINLKTANALGVTIPASLRARADEMIE